VRDCGKRVRQSKIQNSRRETHEKEKNSPVLNVGGCGLVIGGKEKIQNQGGYAAVKFPWGKKKRAQKGSAVRGEKYR